MKNCRHCLFSVQFRNEACLLIKTDFILSSKNDYKIRNMLRFAWRKKSCSWQSNHFELNFLSQVFQVFEINADFIVSSPRQVTCSIRRVHPAVAPYVLEVGSCTRIMYKNYQKFNHCLLISPISILLFADYHKPTVLVRETAR